MLNFSLGNLIFQLVVLLVLIVPIVFCCVGVFVIRNLRKTVIETKALEVQNHAILKKLEERSHLNTTDEQM